MAEIAQLLGHSDSRMVEWSMRNSARTSAQGLCDVGVLMVVGGRIELPTFAMSKQRSTTELGALTGSIEPQPYP